MAVLSRLSPDRWGNHAHDHECQRANAPELTPKHQKQRQTQGKCFAGSRFHRTSLIPTHHGHPGRGLREVPSPQPVLAVSDSYLSRALALSLEDSTTEDQFQADLQRALEESQSQPQFTPQPIPQTAMASTSANPNSFLSERAQLERERLARQKRLRGGGDDRNSSRGPTPSTSTADSEGYESDDLGKPAAKRQHLATPQQSRTLRQSKSKQSASVIGGSSKPNASSNASTNQPQMFWRGEVRQTANMHVDPKKDVKPTFRLSEIIGEVRPTVPVSRSRASSLRIAAKRCSLCNHFLLLNRLRVCIQDVFSCYARHHHIPPRRRE